MNIFKNFFSLIFVLNTLSYADLFDEYLWKNRIVVIFGDNAFKSEVNKYYKNEKFELDDRDIVWFDVKSTQDSFYRYFRLDKNENRFYLLGKDGGVKLSSSEVIKPKRLYSVIDAMPMRQTEMRNK